MHKLLYILLLTSICAVAQAQDESAEDERYTDSITGKVVHYFRLSENDTLVTPDHNALKPILESMAINFAVWGWDHYVTDRGWADVDGKIVRRNLKHDWVLDTDSYSGNQFSHPFHGSMFYNAARYHGLNYYQSALYPLVGSMVWEYFCERNPPSYNDFLSTGIGGSAIGETTHRITDLVFDDSKRGASRVMRELFGTLLNPARGVHRLISGESWHVRPSRGRHEDPEPFTFDFGAGTRYVHAMRGDHHTKNIPYIDFNVNYGDRLEKKDKPKPYDFFRVHLLINLGGGNPTFNDLDIRGRLLSHQFGDVDGWRHDLGLYQVYRYIDNYNTDGDDRPGQFALINEACSFGGGIYSEKRNAHSIFSHELMVDAIGFGGTTADYFQPRRYDFGSGFSARDEVRYVLNRRLTVGDDFYYARLFVPKGPEDPGNRGNTYWGDQGYNSIFYNKAYLQLTIIPRLRLDAEHVLYYRRSGYKHFSNVHAKSYEVKMGLVYSM